MSLGDITTEAMRAAFARYAETHEAASIQRCWSTWNVLCTFLYTSELIAADPMPLVGRPKIAKTLPKGLPPNSVAALLASLDSEPERRRSDWVERDRALILTSLLAGLRADELVRANVGDVRSGDDGAVIHVRGKAARIAASRSSRRWWRSSRTTSTAASPGFPPRPSGAPPPAGDWPRGVRPRRCSSARTGTESLAADDGPLQMSLFDDQDLAEITHPDYPGERLVACRNPALAHERTRKRDELLAATEALLAAIAERVHRGGLAGADRIGEAVGRVIGKHKVGKHFERHITDTEFTYRRDQTRIDAEAALDGIYVLRTSMPAADLDAPGVVTGYKNLAHVERDFRIIKTDDLDLRPIHHRLDERVKAHVLICLLACYLTWHLRQAWAPLTFTDEQPPTRDNPVAPARRSEHAQAKASRQQAPDGTPLRSFRSLLDHLGTLTRNDIRYHGTTTEVPALAEPTPDQRRAFDLIGTTIPLTIAT